MATAVVINSGFSVSSAFQVGKNAFALYVPSSSIGAHKVQFSDAIDATSANFGTLQDGNSTGLDFICFSGNGPAMTWPVPAATAYARIKVGAALTFPVSFSLYPVNQF